MVELIYIFYSISLLIVDFLFITQVLTTSLHWVTIYKYIDRQRRKKKKEEEEEEEEEERRKKKKKKKKKKKEEERRTR